MAREKSTTEATRSGRSNVSLTCRALTKALIGIEYLGSIPKQIPRGRVLVHNTVKPGARSGNRGSRFWLESGTRKELEKCDCGWHPKLKAHYRVAIRGNDEATEAMKRVAKACRVKLAGKRALQPAELKAALLDSDRLRSYWRAKIGVRKARKAVAR